MTPAASSLLAVIGLWLTLAFFCCGVRNRSVTRTAGSTTAAELIADYQTNEVRADAQWKGRLLTVSGVVDSVGKDITDSPYVTLTNGDKMSVPSVQCMVNESSVHNLLSLSPGQRIAVVGVCEGKMFNVLLTDCSVR